MSSVVLHVCGEAFDPAPILAKLSLRPYSEYRKGERRFPDNPKSEKRHELGGFKCEVSTADWIIANQVNDVIAFLRKYYEDLASLPGASGVEAVWLDFGYECRLNGKEICVQCDYLPPELLRLAGELGIGIELSLYPMEFEALAERLAIDRGIIQPEG